MGLKWLKATQCPDCLTIYLIYRSEDDNIVRECSCYDTMTECKSIEIAIREPR